MPQILTIGYVQHGVVYYMRLVAVVKHQCSGDWLRPADPGSTHSDLKLRIPFGNYTKKTECVMAKVTTAIDRG